MIAALARPFAGRRFRHARDVIAVLVARDLKVLYKRSALGVGWALANPLLQAIIFVLVFHRALGGTVRNYGAFVFTGVIVWGWFHASLGQSTSLITSSRALVRQPGFPLALLPVVTVAVRLFHLMLALPILVAVLAFQGLHPTAAWCALPLLVAIQFALTTGLAYPLAALNVRVRDTQHLVGVALQLLMYMTPVFYHAEAVAAPVRRWLELNPMVPLLAAWRGVVLEGRWPDPITLAPVAALAGVLLAAGRRFFARESRRFVEEL